MNGKPLPNLEAAWLYGLLLPLAMAYAWYMLQWVMHV